MSYIPNHFKLYEFLCPHAYKKYVEQYGWPEAKVWAMIDPRLLKTMDWIRETTGRKVTINTWYWSGGYSERGVRCNLCSIVQSNTRKNNVYLSAHPMGQGVDFDVEGWSGTQTRAWIQKNSESIPYPIRLERKKNGKDISWVHLDVREESNKKVYLFDV